jgi:hypothetical protein
MQLESKKFLHDIRDSALAITDYVSGQGRDAYAANRMLRRAVEREFEIIGEAMSQLAKRDPDIAAAIGEHRQIISFRKRPDSRLSTRGRQHGLGCNSNKTADARSAGGCSAGGRPRSSRRYRAMTASA